MQQELFCYLQDGESFPIEIVRDVIKRLLIDTLDCMRLRKRMLLYVFVIMPNHIHVIIQCPPDNPVSDWIRDYKKHTADRIIRQYRVEENIKALNFLENQVPNSNHQNYKVWEDGYNVKNVFSTTFLRQKIDYIHNNPCQSHGKLAVSSIDYPWSSARFYLSEKPSIIPVTDVRKLIV